METTNAVETKTYSIPEIKLSSLRKSLDSMVKRAHKLGIEACSYTVGKTFDLPYVYGLDHNHRFNGTAEQLKRLEDQGKIYYNRFVEVTIAGPAPVLDGWEFVGTLQHLKDDQGNPMNILRTRPDFEGKLPERFRAVTAGNCDHCHQNRVRKDTYVVRNVANGEWKQIGSTCIRDFCGGNDPCRVAEILSWWLDTDRDLGGGDDDSWDMGPRGEERYSLREFLAVTAAVIRQEGWMSRKQAEIEMKTSTSQLVLESFHNAREAAQDKAAMMAYANVQATGT